MMKLIKTLYLIYIILFAFSNCYSQNSITGRIVNEENEPLPYANISITGTSIGVVSNSDGYFKITFNNQYINDSLIISYIGYKAIKEPVNSLINKENVFILKRKSFNIKGVVVKPETGLEVVLKAIKKIPENYYTKPYYIDAFYRESMIEDSTYTQLAEAACRFYMDTLYNIDEHNSINRFLPNNWASSAFEMGFAIRALYDNYYLLCNNDRLKVIESRASVNNSKSLIKFNFIGGPIGLIAIDKIRYPIQFLDRKKIKKYSFKIEDILFNGNTGIYKIFFTQKRKRKRKFSYTGYIYINTQDYAILSIEYHVSDNYVSYKKMHPHQIPRYGIAFNKRKPMFDRGYYSGYSAKINYSYSNGKYFLKSIHQENDFTYYFVNEKKTAVINEKRDLIVNNVALKDVKQFNSDSTFELTAISNLFDYPFDYHKDFWERYNMLMPTELEQKAISDLSKEQPLDKQFESRNKYNPDMKPPVAKKERSVTVIHNDTLIDEYAWMENRNDPLVQKYLENENNYTGNYFLSLKEVERSLFYEMKNRLPKTDVQTAKIGNYIYYAIEDKESNYPVIYRKKDKAGAKKELVLDIVKLSLGRPTYEFNDISVSPDNKILAFSEHLSETGNFYYRFKNLTTGKFYNNTLINGHRIYWLNNLNILYVQRDSLRRNYRCAVHKLGTPQTSDITLYLEKDNTKDIGFKLSSSKKYLFLYSKNAFGGYVQIQDISKPYSKNKNGLNFKESVFKINHFDDDSVFYIYTYSENDMFSIYKTPVNLETKKLSLVYTPEEDVILRNYFKTDNYLILKEQKGMTEYIKIIDIGNNDKKQVVTGNKKFCNIQITDCTNDSIQYWVSTMVEPAKKYVYNIKDKKIKKIKEESISGYDPSKYVSKILWATAKDSTKIPILLFYRKDLKKRKNNYLILTAYAGDFNSLNYYIPEYYLSLVDRGFIYSKALVRGGGELGMKWYLSGKKLNRLNSFNDFVACSEYLIEKGYTTPEKFVIEGVSAGGLLIGYAVNTHPELYKVAILSRPLIDVLALLDTTLPIVTTILDEMGNPYNKKEYEYLKSYSPYNNIKAQNYPSMLFITGAKDLQVNYWEPAKMVAKLRATKTGNSTILLKTFMNSGHAGMPGKYGIINEQAMIFSFILNEVGYIKKE